MAISQNCRLTKIACQAIDVSPEVSSHGRTTADPVPPRTGTYN